MCTSITERKSKQASDYLLEISVQLLKWVFFLHLIKKKILKGELKVAKRVLFNSSLGLLLCTSEKRINAPDRYSAINGFSLLDIVEKLLKLLGKSPTENVGTRTGHRTGPSNRTLTETEKVIGKHF